MNLADRQNGVPPSDEASRLDGYEKEFADKVEAKAAQPVVDYSRADDYDLSAVSAFTAAAAPVSREAIRKPGDTESQSADIKKPSQPFGGGGMKPG
jgi:hypothetical protein